MAFVTAKTGGRYEIRETEHAPSGPRSRTLVTFRTLNDEVLDRARARASGSFDEYKVRRGARKLGAPMEDHHVDQLARDLLSQVSRGHLPSPGLRRLLVDALTQSGLPAVDNLGDLSLWVGASDDERARALEGLLDLADAIPTNRRSTTLSFPRLPSAEIQSSSPSR
ncbi:MAG TPA: hypothetical protein VG298_02890 [Acidimicrobiales bacterium]|jgi:hypothetical protein|nr:hypothetical protein [Acidimicrobiales bacterium]